VRQRNVDETNEPKLFERSADDAERAVTTANNCTATTAEMTIA